MVAFTWNVFCALPLFMAFLTLFACCLGRFKAFRVFIFIANVLRSIGAITVYTVWAVYIFAIQNWPSAICEKFGTELDDHTIEMRNGTIYDSLEDCIE